MPRRNIESPEKQGKKSVNDGIISVKPRGRKIAVPFKADNPTSKIKTNNRVQRSTVTTRSMAVVPPNNITSSTNTRSSMSNSAAVNVVASPLSTTPTNISALGNVNNNQLQRPTIVFARSLSDTNVTTDGPSGNQEDEEVTYLYSCNTSDSRRVVEEVDLSQESELQRPEMIAVRPPFDTNVRTDDPLGNQDNDDVTYLYRVDTSAAGRVVEEVDLSHESEETEEPVSEKKQTVTKNRKRKAEGDEVSNKRSAPKNGPTCSVCFTHYDSLIDNEIYMFTTNCGHLICHPCTRKVPECQTCGEKIRKMCRVFF